MNLLVIRSIESRILTGITMFVGIMILVGWVAINEEARMQAFVRQHTGRSIERGAELYASLCSECHGEEGHGAGDRAPGLNNPHLFGFDPVGEQTAAITTATRTLVRFTEDTDSLLAEFTDADNPPDAERQDEILAQLEELEAQISEQQTLIETAVAERAATLETLDTAVDNGLFPLWDSVVDIETTSDNEVEVFFNNNGTRLAQVGWAGDLQGYVVTTLIHGRPGSARVYPNSTGMAAWSQTAGGPLRQDQIEDLAAYIINWDKGANWTTEDFLAVAQYGKPLADGSLPSEPPPPPAGDNVAGILARWAEMEIVGSPATGELLYDAEFGCTDCHTNGASAPDTVGTATRVRTERLTLPQFAGYTVEQYLVESITRPGDYVVDGYSSGLMPSNFGARMTDQQLADIVAFLLTQE
ncbi:MAG: c-type cytochrome [Chloroflexi bacterium]|nr:c-type cytochrome [Chloroflexota bacterium]MCY3581206.1 c-type cytochrome [Chloroflexota bacterium]MCY3716804.1 c-type cytochrome [Chloroflexota bacterium]MDE2649171.1 c-type cytochrome [Chloroflexota bacterium]MXV92572.1 cytochrome c [Chloroflexota bacterium]